jgi:hypothetical protein
MSNSDSTTSNFQLALFADQSPADCAEQISLLADFLASVVIEDSDHPGLTLVHRIIRDSSAALGKRLAA